MESAGVRYLRTRCFGIRNLIRSLCSLLRFLIRQQLVRKYRTPALSMKYSLYVCVRHLLLLMYQPEAHWVLKLWVLLSQMLAHLNNQNNVFKRTRIIAIFS